VVEEKARSLKASGCSGNSSVKTALRGVDRYRISNGDCHLFVCVQIITHTPPNKMENEMRACMCAYEYLRHLQFPLCLQAISILMPHQTKGNCRCPTE